ncbi:MAG: hypothetical protein HYU69_15990 [Bacteroidetes bacterium]|nr:hypothetical protein [Bacteroidota bacterium]
MARKTSAFLHQLIHSMTKGEKRSFRWHVLKDSNPQKKDERLYIKLFDTISKQKVYNEPRILKTIGEIKPRQLPGFKNYLCKIIIESLEQSNTGASIDIIIRKHINQLQILFGKGMYWQCKTILNKAGRLALQFENFLLLAELYSWKRKLYVSQYSAERENKIITEENEIYRKINIEKEYDHLLLKINTYLNKQRTSRSKKENRKHIDPIRRSGIMQNENHTVSFKSKRIFYYIKAAIAYIEENNKRSLQYTKKLIEHFRNNPHQINEHTDQYIIDLNNFIVNLVRLRRYKEASEELLVELKQYLSDPFIPGIARTNAFNFYYSHLTNIALQTNDFSAIIPQIKDFDEQLPLHINSSRKAYLIVIFYNIISIYFIAADYKKCLKWINKLFNEFTEEIRSDLQSIARIISIMTHFELGNVDLIRLQAGSAYRDLEQKRRLYKFENIMLSFFQRNIFDEQNKPEQNAAFVALKKELLKLMKNSYEKKPFDYFDFISWVDSKILNCPFAEMVEEKLKSAAH